MSTQGESGNQSTPAPVVLSLQGMFESEQALRDAVVESQLCFDHEPFVTRTGEEHLAQLGFQLNLYAAFRDPHYLPGGEDAELLHLLDLLGKLCRVLAHSLSVLTPCEHPFPPMHRVVYAPERHYRAEVCMQIPFIEQPVDGAPSQEREGALLAAAERLLRYMGARRGTWDSHSESFAA